MSEVRMSDEVGSWNQIVAHALPSEARGDQTLGGEDRLGARRIEGVRTSRAARGAKSTATPRATVRGGARGSRSTRGA